MVNWPMTKEIDYTMEKKTITPVNIPGKMGQLHVKQWKYNVL